MACLERDMAKLAGRCVPGRKMGLNDSCHRVPTAGRPLPVSPPPTMPSPGGRSSCFPRTLHLGRLSSLPSDYLEPFMAVP